MLSPGWGWLRGCGGFGSGWFWHRNAPWLRALSFFDVAVALPHAPGTASHGHGGTSRCEICSVGWDGWEPWEAAGQPSPALCFATLCLHRPVLAQLCPPPAGARAVAAAWARGYRENLGVLTWMHPHHRSGWGGQAGQCALHPAVAPVWGLWLARGGAGELLLLSGGMCLQQVCLEEAGLVLTGPLAATTGFRASGLGELCGV